MRHVLCNGIVVIVGWVSQHWLLLVQHVLLVLQQLLQFLHPLHPLRPLQFYLLMLLLVYGSCVGNLCIADGQRHFSCQVFQ